MSTGSFRRSALRKFSPSKKSSDADFLLLLLPFTQEGEVGERAGQPLDQGGAVDSTRVGPELRALHPNITKVGALKNRAPCRTTAAHFDDSKASTLGLDIGRDCNSVGLVQAASEKVCTISSACIKGVVGGKRCRQRGWPRSHPHPRSGPKAVIGPCTGEENELRDLFVSSLRLLLLGVAEIVHVVFILVIHLVVLN